MTQLLLTAQNDHAQLPCLSTAGRFCANQMISATTKFQLVKILSLNEYQRQILSQWCQWNEVTRAPLWWGDGGKAQKVEQRKFVLEIHYTAKFL